MTESAAPPASGPQVEPCTLTEILLITPRRHSDARGYFMEAYNEDAFRKIGVSCRFIQDNQSLSAQRGTIRGMHFQTPPFAQAKLVRVLQGAIFDVVVDIRSGSQTRGKYVSALLSAQNGRQLFVPAGFAHGYCTMESDTVVLYKVDAPYSRAHEGGLVWNDPEVGIAWPEQAEAGTLLERDRQFPFLHGLLDHF
ncbi:MAG TPA: dTDP-4-dehydrorhamnose 3,5-epimerase [Rhizomicrobium sp.]